MTTTTVSSSSVSTTAITTAGTPNSSGTLTPLSSGNSNGGAGSLAPLSAEAAPGIPTQGTRLTTRDLEESTGTLPVLGYSTQWNLSQVEISHTDLLMTLRKQGFLTANPERPSPTVALRRAMLRWVQDRALATFSARTLSNAQLPQMLWGEEEETGESGLPGGGSNGSILKRPSDFEGEGEGGRLYLEDDEGEDGDADAAGSNYPGGSIPKTRGKGAGGKRRNQATRRLLRKINSAESDWLVFSLVIEQLDLDALGLSYATRLRVFLHKKTLEIKVSQTETGFEREARVREAVFEEDNENSRSSATQEGNTTPELANITSEICQLFYYYREHHQARDISMLLKQLVEGLDSFSLRRLGGVYFVPQQHQGALENLRKLVEELPATAGRQSDKFMLKLPILDGNGAKRQLAQAAHRDFLMELAGMQSDLDHLTEEAAHRQLRPDTVSRRLTDYRELKAKAEVYADLLDMQQGRILTAVDRLSAQAVLLLDSLTDPSFRPVGEQQTFDWDNLAPETSAGVRVTSNPIDTDNTETGIERKTAYGIAATVTSLVLG